MEHRFDGRRRGVEEERRTRRGCFDGEHSVVHVTIPVLSASAPTRMSSHADVSAACKPLKRLNEHHLYHQLRG